MMEHGDKYYMSLFTKLLKPVKPGKTPASPIEGLETELKKKASRKPKQRLSIQQKLKAEADSKKPKKK